MSIDVRPAADRFVTEAAGRTTFHSFSYGAHYDPANVGFGPLVALNDERLPPGTGYDEHRHSGIDIVTWVLDGRLHHADSLGNTAVLEPGTIAVARTGTGISHAEHARPDRGVRFLQLMLRPEDPDSAPAYNLTRVPPEPGTWRVWGPGTDGLVVSRLEPGAVDLPASARLHVFVVSGRVVIGDRELGADDAARLVDEPGRVLTVETPALVMVGSFG